LQSVNVLAAVSLSISLKVQVPLILRPGFCFVILNWIFICCIPTRSKRGIACLCCIFSKDVYNQNIVVFSQWYQLKCSWNLLQVYGHRIAFIMSELHIVNSTALFSYLFLNQKRHFSIKLLKMF